MAHHFSVLTWSFIAYSQVLVLHMSGVRKCMYKEPFPWENLNRAYWFLSRVSTTRPCHPTMCFPMILIVSTVAPSTLDADCVKLLSKCLCAWCSEQQNALFASSTSPCKARQVQWTGKDRVFGSWKDLGHERLFCEIHILWFLGVKK